MMIEQIEVDVLDLALLAQLFEYPGERFIEQARDCASQLGNEDCARAILQFVCEIEALSPERLEEAHVRTFLVAPACAPYVGVHLFGEESFKRAHLMARLVGRFRELDFDPGNELPDHLGVLLRFASRMEADERADLVRWCLAVPVTAMHKALAESANPYRHLLSALLAAVAPGGVSEEVNTSIQRIAAAPDQADCGGCKLVLGEDEP